jgi:hypothetical protein
VSKGNRLEGWVGEIGLQEEGLIRQLEGGDRTVGIGEGGLEMGEDLRRGSVGGLRWQRGQQLGRRAPGTQSGADFALALVEPFPDALPGPVAPLAVDGADGSEDAVGDGTLEEPPQSAGGQAEPSDFVGEPDAESASATAPCLAVAAKDPPRTQRLLLVALVKSVQKAVPNECADNLAVGTGRLLEPFGHRVPFLGSAVKPSFLAHSDDAFAKKRDFTSVGQRGTAAG